MTDLQYDVHRVIDDQNYLGEPVNEGNVMYWRHFDIFCVPESVIGRE
jgi:hypothetical protein